MHKKWGLATIERFCGIGKRSESGIIRLTRKRLRTLKHTGEWIEMGVQTVQRLTAGCQRRADGGG